MQTRRHLALALSRLLTGLAVLCLLAWPALASADPVTDAVAQLQQASDEVATVAQQRDTLERDYRARVVRIEQLKDDRGGFVGDLELRAELRAARDAAEELNALADSLRAARATQDQARRLLVGVYDQEIARLEASLFEASFGAQPALIEQLQALQVARETQRRALSQDPLAQIDVPDLRGFQSDDPDEVLAAIAELDDNQEKLNRQLAEVDARIAAIEKQRRLSSFAEDARDETNLFGEEARSIRVTTSAQAAQSGGAASGSTQPPPRADGKTYSDADTQTPGAASGNGGVPMSGAGEGDPSAPPAADENAGSFDGGDDRASDSDTTGGGMADYAIEPLPVNPGTPDVRYDGAPAGAPGLVRSDADLLHVTGATSGRSTPSDSELQTLRKRRQELQRSLGTLGGQREQLQQQVDTLLR